MGKVFYFNDAWTKNEEMVRSRGIVREGHEKVPVKNGLRQGSALGLDGDLFHMGGDRVTAIGEEVTVSGDVVAYFQSEHGGTFRQRWAKDGEGRHVPAERPRRIYSF